MSLDSALLLLIVVLTPVWTLALVGWRLLRVPIVWERGRWLRRLAVLEHWGPLSVQEKKRLGAISILVALITLAATITLVFYFNAQSEPEALSIHFPGFPLYVDALSLYFLLVINFIALAASWHAYFYLQQRPPKGFYRGSVLFHVLMNLFHFTMILTPVMDNLVGLWIAIESTTLVSALLVAYPNTHRAWEAAWKYLLITSTGIIMAFMGTIFLVHGVYTLKVSELHSANWSVLIQHIDQVQKGSAFDFILLAFFFTLAGYGVKAGLAPMHAWLPDAHGEAAPPVSALFSGVLLKAALYAILRFVMLTEKALGPEHEWLIAYVLMGTGLFSLVLAVPFILNRGNHFKRVLAYHSLEHMGIIVFGLGIANAVALFGALLHVFNHALTKALMFLAYGNVLRHLSHEQEDEEAPRDPTGVLYVMPYTGLLLALGGLALVGTPPFNIFMSLWMILWGGVQRWLEVWEGAMASHSLEVYILPAAILLFLLATMLIYFGLVRHLAHILLAPPSRKRVKESVFELLPLLFLMVFTFILGLVILPPLATLIQHSTEILFRK